MTVYDVFLIILIFMGVFAAACILFRLEKMHDTMRVIDSRLAVIVAHKNLEEARAPTSLL